MERIVNLNGTLIEIDRLKGVIHNDYENTNLVKFVLNLKKEYIYNPNTKEYEIQDFNDEIIVDFSSSDIAGKNYFEIKNIWEEYLEERLQ